MSDTEKKPVSASPRRSGQGIADHVRTLISPAVEELGYILWDVEYVKEGADYILRVTIDADEGVTIDDCQRTTEVIDPMLDADDPIANSYLLEVSSPGVERVLTRDEHFAACAGEKVELHFFAPVDGSRSCTGILKGLDESGRIVVEIASEERTFERKNVSRIRTVFDF